MQRKIIWTGALAICLMINIPVLGPVTTSAWSCDGADYENSLQILYETMVVGYNMGLTGDFNKYMPMVQDLSNRALALPPSCQSLIKQWSNNFKNSYNPNSTNCVGDVCCDGSGCYD